MDIFELSKDDVDFIKKLFVAFVIQGNRQQRKEFDTVVDGVEAKLNNPVTDKYKKIE